MHNIPRLKALTAAH